MEVGCDIILKISATRRSSSATATQTTTCHYCRIIEHTRSGPGGRDAKKNKDGSVNDDYGHLSHKSPSTTR